ncbi:MAG: ribosome hibernation-promoting factor, HPF/YfiA family [Candidatus Methylomirabilales bacterium]|nr:ribosome-associated translation inhibitor RaiA [candidate division NC10 bacterium]
MQIFLTGRNLEVTEALRRYAEEKVGKLQKYLDKITSAHIVLSLQKYRQIAEVTLRVRDLTIRGEESTADLYSSIDLVVEKLERQLQKYKGKILNYASRSGKFQGPMASPEEDEGPRVEKTKRFAIKPMSLDEAILQMDLLGHTFYVFRNAQTDEVNVVYRRREDTYGLIEPET